MANKTVVFTNYFLNGTSGLTLLLLDPETAAIGNGAGDTLTAGSNGLFSAVVTEAITGWWNVVVLQGAVVVLEGGKVYFQSNTAGTYQVDDATHAAYAVYDEPMSGHTINGSYGSHLVRSANQNQNTVQITGSQHIAADIHEFQPGVITAADFAAGAITSTVLATDSITSSQIAASAVTEIQSGLASQSSVNTLTSYVDTEVAAIKAKTDQLSFTVANQVDANALSGGSSSSIVVTPVVAQTPVRATATTITTYKGDRSAITVGVFSGTTPVNLSTLGALEVCIQTKAGTDLQLIAAANITISGTSSNYFSFSPNSTAVGTVGRFMWSLRVASSSSKQVIVYGAFVVEDAALAD